MPTDLTNRSQELIIRRLKRDRNQSEFSIENQEIRILELEEEKARILDDIENHKKRILDLDEKITEQEKFAATQPSK